MIIQSTMNVGEAAQSGQQVSSPGAKDVAAAPPVAASPPPDPSPQQLKAAVDKINQSLQQPATNNLQFNIDPNTQRAVVTVVDTQTGDVIRQFPSKEVLAIAEAIKQLPKGIMVNQKA